MNPLISNGNCFRWKFENIEGLKKAETRYSDKFTIQNIDWKLSIRKFIKAEEHFLISLVYDCSNKMDKNWICYITGEMKLLSQMERTPNRTEIRSSCCDEKSNSIDFKEFSSWSDLIPHGFLDNDSLIIEAVFDFKYYDFSKIIPNFTDITFNVKGTEFHVNKGVLCSRSEYFCDLFVKRNNQETTINIDDENVEEFRYFIASFYPHFNCVEEKNYEKLIQLATKYGVANLHSSCEMFLISNTKMGLGDKLKYAEQNNYQELLTSCLASLRSAQEIKQLQKSDLFQTLKESTRLSIMVRITDFL